MRRAQGRLTIASISTEVERVLKLAGSSRALFEAAVSETATAGWKQKPNPGMARALPGKSRNWPPTRDGAGRLVGDDGRPLIYPP